MGKMETLHANGSRAVSTGKVLAISLTKSVGLISIVAVLTYWLGLFTIQNLNSMVNAGISLPISVYAAYGLVAVAIVTYSGSRRFICKAVKKDVGSKRWWNLAHGVFIVASLAMAGWLLGNNLAAWAIGVSTLWASAYTWQTWKASATTGLSREELDDIFSDEPVRQGPNLQVA